MLTTTSTSEKTFTVPELSNYRYIYLIRVESCANPAICPVSIFKSIPFLQTANIGRGISGTEYDTSYGGKVIYISDTSVKANIITEGTLRLYGIK